MQLSNQQAEAASEILRWRQRPNNKTFVLAGYAGTGKTTLAKYLANQLGADDVIFCAYTGKAANVLKQKGCSNAGTVHSYLYIYVDDDDEGPRFMLDPNSAMATASLVILDEYSMLPQYMINDLESVAKKILYLGDPFQLPPVKGEQKVDPDFFLTDVHRQALDSPILRAATKIRQNETLSFSTEGDFIYQPLSKMGDDVIFSVDQCIVGRNKTRRQWNNTFLEHYGFSNSCDDVPRNGEKIICLKNDKKLGLFNGMIGTAHNCGYANDNFYLSFDCDGQIYSNLKTAPYSFLGQDIPSQVRNRYNHFDYAYAITCHKSQGSEFESVFIYNEAWGTPEEKRRWTYTALTRASKRAYLADRD